MAKYDFLDGERVRKAHSLRTIPPVFQSLATNLSRIPELGYIKIFPDRMAASNLLSDDGKKSPVVVVGQEGLVGVELLVDVPNRIVQFYALTSATKGCGRPIVDAVVNATPEGWFLAVPRQIVCIGPQSRQSADLLATGALARRRPASINNGYRARPAARA